MSVFFFFLVNTSKKLFLSFFLFYLAPALSFFPFKANVKAILETLDDNLEAPGPEVKCFKISRVDCAALKDIFVLILKEKKDKKIWTRGER